MKTKFKKRPTVKAWLIRWFRKNGGKTPLSELCYWMPHGLWGPKRQLFDAFEELGVDVSTDGILSVDPLIYRGRKGK